MINTIDRQLIFSYFKAYVVCLVSMLSLYVVVDLFTNLDDFMQKHNGLGPVVEQIARWYGAQIPKIFDRLCEAIILLAGMFTIAWMQRSNELLPLLSAGVSTHRVVRPIILSACMTLSLTIANQELLLPRLQDRLFSSRDDLDNTKAIPAGAMYPTSTGGVHVEGQNAYRNEKRVEHLCVLIKEGVLRATVHLDAREARYVPGEGHLRGGWLMTETTPAEVEDIEHPEILERIDPGKYFFYTTEVDFDSLTRPPKWYQYSSTAHLYAELQRTHRQAAVAVLFHMRLTRPILGILLVVMGLSVILRDQNRNVFISAGMCLVLCAVFFITIFCCQQLGDKELLSPPLAAWLPVLVFGPLAFVMFDAVHT